MRHNGLFTSIKAGGLQNELHRFSRRHEKALNIRMRDSYRTALGDLSSKQRRHRTR